MKKILLSSAAVFAFAGAAFAEVTITGDAELGVNEEINGGVYWGVGLTVKASGDVGNGWTAAGSLDIDLDEGANTTFGLGSIDASDWVLSLSSDMGGLYFGDTALAADKYWAGVTNMNDDGFAENGDGTEEAVLRLEYIGSSFEVAISTMVGSAAAGQGQTDGLTFGAMADLGSVSLYAAYQDDDVTGGSIYGVSAGVMVGGVDLMLAYASSDAGNTSTGLSASYGLGDVTVGVFYVLEDVEDDNYGVTVGYESGPLSIDAFFHGGGDEDLGLHVGYEVASGTSVYVGHSDDDGSYVGVEHELSDYATFTFSYGDDVGNDEIGPQEYLDGLDINLSLTF